MKYEILTDNIPVLKALGLYHWIFDGGFDGGSCTIVTSENPPITPNMCGLVSNPFPNIETTPAISNDETILHAYETAHAALQFAPGVHIVTAPDSFTQNSDGTITGFLHDVLIPWVLKNRPVGGFRSQNCMWHGMDVEYGKVADFCFLVCSNGNTDQNDAEYSRLIDDASWCGISAAFYNPNQGFFPAYYSDAAPTGDFAFPGSFAVPALNGVPMYINGTSFAAPAFMGMCAVVQDFFFKKLGRFLTCAELYDFLKSCRLDIGDPGKDSLSGWGIPILPTYESIDLTKYAKPVTVSDTPAPGATPAASDHDSCFDDAVNWAISTGLFHGDGNGNYRWRDNITRQEIAQVFYNKFK